MTPIRLDALPLFVSENMKSVFTSAEVRPNLTRVCVQRHGLGVLHQVDEGHEVAEEGERQHHGPDHEPGQSERSTAVT